MERFCFQQYFENVIPIKINYSNFLSYNIERHVIDETSSIITKSTLLDPGPETEL